MAPQIRRFLIGSVLTSLLSLFIYLVFSLILKDVNIDKALIFTASSFIFIVGLWVITFDSYIAGRTNPKSKSFLLITSKIISKFALAPFNEVVEVEIKLLREIADKYIIQTGKSKQQYPKLSIIGIIRQRSTTEAASALVILAGSLLIVTMFPSLFTVGYNPVLIICLMLFVIVLSLAKNYRIRKGFYGSSEREAREIIEFILENTNDVDFTDRGKPKRIFSIEDLEEIREQVFDKNLGVSAD